MKKLLLFVFLFTSLANAQSKKKKRLAEDIAAMEIRTNLMQHAQYLADDKLEGRRTGTKGAQLAQEYLVHQYTQMGLEPKGKEGFLQTFEINEGKQIDLSTSLVVNDKTLDINTHFFPLANSAQKSIKGNPAMALNEKGQPWFIDLKEILEENKNNPQFDLEQTLHKNAATVASNGATALFLYNSSGIVDNVQFNKNDKTAELPIPVVYITKAGIKDHFTDLSASLNVVLKISISERKRNASNVVGFINNNATNTVILGAHYDHLGYKENRDALDTGHIIHNGADDNASGTAALIELARMLKKFSPKNNNYLIIHFSAEELGLLGSKHWLDSPANFIAPNYMLNMDMDIVGRSDTAQKLSIGGYGTSPAWGAYFAANPNNNLRLKLDSSGTVPIDHASFYRKDIPVLFYFTDNHPDYHKATDDWGKINFDAERQIVQSIYQLIVYMDEKGKLAFTN